MVSKEMLRPENDFPSLGLTLSFLECFDAVERP